MAVREAELKWPIRVVLNWAKVAKADWKSLGWGLRPVLHWSLSSCEISDKSFPSQSPSSYQVSGRDTAPSDPCTALSSPPGFLCASPHNLLSGQQPGSTILPGAERLPCGLRTCFVSTSCLLLVPDKVNTEFKSNCSETLEQRGAVVLCVIKLII